jgi:hypothetical protein
MRSYLIQKKAKFKTVCWQDITIQNQIVIGYCQVTVIPYDTN